MAKFLKQKRAPKNKHLILMCNFLNNVWVPILLQHLDFGGCYALRWALLRGSAGDWPEIGQNGPKHAFLLFLGFRNDPRVPIRGVRAPILTQHLV